MGEHRWRERIKGKRLQQPMKPLVGSSSSRQKFEEVPRSTGLALFVSLAVRPATPTTISHGRSYQVIRIKGDSASRQLGQSSLAHLALLSSQLMNCEGAMSYRYLSRYGDAQDHSKSASAASVTALGRR